MTAPPEAVAELAPGAKVVGTGRNLGFAAGCNAGAAEASGDLLVILNPDAAPLPGFGEAIRRPWLQEPRLGRLAGAGRRRGGTRINSDRQPRPLHRDRLGRGPRRADRRGAPGGRGDGALGRLSGDPASYLARFGGLPEQFFLYHEDVDLSLRLRLRGGTLGIEPAAVVDHDYEFGAREHKWRWLERNRLAFLVRTYPASLLSCSPRRCSPPSWPWSRSRSRVAGGARSSPPTSNSSAGSPRLLRERR